MHSEQLHVFLRWWKGVLTCVSVSTTLLYRITLKWAESSLTVKSLKNESKISPRCNFG